MSTTKPPARFIPSTDSLHRQPAVRTILWLILTGLLLVTAACGDIQDPAAGAPGAQLSHPSITQTSHQQTGGENGDVVPPPAEYPGVEAGQPFPVDPLPPSTGMPSDPPPQTLASEKPETQPVTFEWNPSPSGDAAGYKILVTTVSAKTQYTFETGQETRLTVNLPRGEGYYATVLAFNSAGQSPRTDFIRFDLF